MAKSQNTLGIDVGGTKVAAGLVSLSGNVTKLKIYPTSKNDLPGQLAGIINEFKDYSAIGIGMPGQVGLNGEVSKLANLPKFKRVNVKKFLEQKTGKKVFVENDAKCFAYAEALLGFGRSYSSVAGIILGTGIGVGIVIDKKIYRGADGVAGELGQFPMLDGKSLEEHVRTAGKFNHAREAKHYLNLLLSYVVLSFNPEVIVLGGAWSRLSGMMPVTRQALSQLAYETETKIHVSNLPYSGLIGAALLALKK
jgi:predicted NBD/HSP70 family sugar kinase